MHDVILREMLTGVDPFLDLAAKRTSAVSLLGLLQWEGSKYVYMLGSLSFSINKIHASLHVPCHNFAHSNIIKLKNKALVQLCLLLKYQYRD